MKIRSTLFPTLCAALAAALFTQAAPAADTKPAPSADTKTAPAPAVPVADQLVRLQPNQALPKTVTQLTVIDREPGDAKGATAETGAAALVQYTGWLYDPAKADGKGAQFDSSVGNLAPFGFLIGAGRVIKGWDRGVVGMKVKGKRTLIIPPQLAYGDTGNAKIPANSTLLFDIELVDVIATRTAATAPAPPPALAPVFLKAGDKLPASVETLTMIDQAVGSGRTAEPGKPVRVHYTGWLYDAAQAGGRGKKFDSSVDRNQPFDFPLGGGRVIRGWDQGVAGMKVKGKRTLIIPPQLGYGGREVGGGLIPAGSTLLFDVELLEVDPAPKQ